MFNLDPNARIVDGSFMILKCTSHEFDYSKCDKDIGGARSCSVITDPTTLKQSSVRFELPYYEDAPLQLNTTLINPLSTGLTKWTVEIQYPSGTVSHRQHGTHLDGSALYQVSYFLGSASCTPGVAGRLNYCTFDIHWDPPALTLQHKVLVVGEDYDFTPCTNGAIEGIRSCRGSMDQAEIVFYGSVFTRQKFSISFIQPASVENSYLIFRAYVNTVLTHEGPIRMPSTSNIPVFDANVVYNSAENSVSNVLFAFSPRDTNLTDSGYLHIECLTKGYKLSSNGVHGNIGGSARLVQMEKEIEKGVGSVNKVDEVWIKSVSILASNYTVSMSVHTPSISAGKGMFRLSLKDDDKNGLERGVAEGMGLTRQYGVRVVSVGVRSATPETSTKGFVRLSLFAASKDPLAITITLMHQYMNLDVAMRKDQYAAGGFEIDTIVGRNFIGSRILHLDFNRSGPRLLTEEKDQFRQVVHLTVTTKKTCEGQPRTEY
eukprot:Platyproteum_vivax@DN5304_c0_g1_i1.p1